MFGLPFRIAAVCAGLSLAAFGLSTAGLVLTQRALTAERGRAAALQVRLTAADTSLKARDAAIRENAATDKREAEQLASNLKETCHAAFNAGYAARRCAPGEPVGLRDLSDLWRAGAFPGSADLPPQPDG